MNTFWSEAERADGAVVPVQSGVRVLLLVVKVSPKRMSRNVSFTTQNQQPAEV